MTFFQSNYRVSPEARDALVYCTLTLGMIDVALPNSKLIITIMWSYFKRVTITSLSSLEPRSGSVTIYNGLKETGMASTTDTLRQKLYYAIILNTFSFTIYNLCLAICFQRDGNSSTNCSVVRLDGTAGRLLQLAAVIKSFEVGAFGTMKLSHRSRVGNFE